MGLKICIDAGHGGKDSGAVGFGLCEKDVVLKLAKMLNDELGNYKDVVVTLTRWEDKYLTLQERCDHANKMGVDLFVSMHDNAADESAHGYESYVARGLRAKGATAAKVQDKIHAHIMGYLSKFGITDRGKREAGYYVLKHTNMPAILFENLFITNGRENKLLRDDEFLRGLAKAYAEALAEVYNLPKKQDKPEPKPEPKPESKPDMSGKLYHVQIGAYADKESAEQLAAKLKAEGYPAVVKYE